jgi:hypothetical protein
MHGCCKWWSVVCSCQMVPSGTWFALVFFYNGEPMLRFLLFFSWCGEFLVRIFSGSAWRFLLPKYVLSSLLDIPVIIFEPLFFLTKQKEGECFTCVRVLLWFMQGQVYVLQIASPSYFCVLEDSWRDLLGFSVKIFATKSVLSLLPWFIVKILTAKACLVFFNCLSRTKFGTLFFRINKNKENAICCDQVNTALSLCLYNTQCLHLNCFP